VVLVLENEFLNEYLQILRRRKGERERIREKEIIGRKKTNKCNVRARNSTEQLAVTTTGSVW
jgi:hypothetical protein